MIKREMKDFIINSITDNDINEFLIKANDFLDYYFNDLDKKGYTFGVSICPYQKDKLMIYCYNQEKYVNGVRWINIQYIGDPFYPKSYSKLLFQDILFKFLQYKPIINNDKQLSNNMTQLSLF